jgi:hypothetical protein
MLSLLRKFGRVSLSQLLLFDSDNDHRVVRISLILFASTRNFSICPRTRPYFQRIFNTIVIMSSDDDDDELLIRIFQSQAENNKRKELALANESRKLDLEEQRLELEKQRMALMLTQHEATMNQQQATTELMKSLIHLLPNKQLMNQEQEP